MKKKETKELNFTTKEIKKSKQWNDDSKKALSFLVVLAVVSVLIAGLFFLNAKFVSKDYFQEDVTTTTKAAEYDDTLLTVDTMLSKDGEYYVLAYDSKDKYTSFVYSSLVSSYKNDKIKLYSIDLSLKMNSMYYDTKKDVVVKENEYNFNGATLITIKNKKIVKSITDRDEIVKVLS